MGHYQRVFGLKALGRHRRRARMLLRDLRAGCSLCDCTGLRGDEHEWSRCDFCGGAGGFWTAPGRRIAAAYRRILDEYPDALAPSGRDNIRSAIRQGEVTRKIRCGDRFALGFCAECSYSEAAFCFRGMIVGVCPLCVQSRIDELEKERGNVLGDLRILRKEASREVGRQDRRSRQPYSVNFDDFVKCARCSRLLQTADARYPRRSEGGPIPPHCRPCYLEVSGA